MQQYTHGEGYSHVQCTCGEGVHACCSAHIEKLCTCCGAHVEIKGQFVGVCSPLTSCGSWEANSGHQPWSQEPVPTDPSLQGFVT